MPLKFISLHSSVVSNALIASIVAFSIFVSQNTYAQNLLLTNERIAQIKDHRSTSSDAWEYTKRRVDAYIDRVPYNSGEYAAASALLYQLDGDKKYLDNAVRLLKVSFATEHEGGWEYFKSRNLFRVFSKWAFFGYDWVYSDLSESDRLLLTNNFAVWARYWVDYALDENGELKLRDTDTDEVTSLASNLNLLGHVLLSSPQHEKLGEEVTALADQLLNDIVISKYMDNLMQGGVWAEGSDYSAGTQIHWLLSYLINKESRGIPYPNNYASDTLSALSAMTMGNYTTTYKFGSEEAAVDYDALSDDFRYEFVLLLLAVVEEDDDIAKLTDWWIAMLSRDGYKDSSIHLGLWRLLFEHKLMLDKQPSQGFFDVAASTDSVNSENDSSITEFFSSGVGLYSAKAKSLDGVNDLFFINRKIRVDHEHQDALSFDFAYKSQWISKEASGYSGAATSSRAHNTILIENATDGSSSPTFRPQDNPTFHFNYADELAAIVSADGAPAYNMKGYFASEYAKQVLRQLVMFDEGIVLVHDRVVTDSSVTADLVQYHPELLLNEGERHDRWVNVIQHTQSKPELISGESNLFQYEAEQATAQYRVLWPETAVTEVIDEKELWKDIETYEVPENQKKWHIQVEDPAAKEQHEFIALLSAKDSEQSVGNNAQVTASVLDMSLHNLDTTDFIGVIVKVNDSHRIVLFNRNPDLNEQAELPVFQTPTNIDVEVVYVLGVLPDRQYTLSQRVANGSITYTVAESNNGLNASNSVLSFRP